MCKLPLDFIEISSKFVNIPLKFELWSYLPEELSLLRRDRAGAAAEPIHGVRMPAEAAGLLVRRARAAGVQILLQLRPGQRSDPRLVTHSGQVALAHRVGAQHWDYLIAMVLLGDT